MSLCHPVSVWMFQSQSILCRRYWQRPRPICRLSHVHVHVPVLGDSSPPAGLELTRQRQLISAVAASSVLFLSVVLSGALVLATVDDDSVNGGLLFVSIGLLGGATVCGLSMGIVSHLVVHHMEDQCRAAQRMESIVDCEYARGRFKPFEWREQMQERQVARLVGKLDRQFRQSRLWLTLRLITAVGVVLELSSVVTLVSGMLCKSSLFAHSVPNCQAKTMLAISSMGLCLLLAAGLGYWLNTHNNEQAIVAHAYTLKYIDTVEVAIGEMELLNARSQTGHMQPRQLREEDKADRPEEEGEGNEEQQEQQLSDEEMHYRGAGRQLSRMHLEDAECLLQDMAHHSSKAARVRAWMVHFREKEARHTQAVTEMADIEVREKQQRRNQENNREVDV